MSGDSAYKILQRQEMSARRLQEIQYEFQETIKPILRELTLLQMFTTIFLNKDTGEITYKYPPDISELRKKCYEMIEEIKSEYIVKKDIFGEVR